MKTYEVYVKTDCNFCKKAVDLLSTKQVPFIVTVCDKNPDYLDNMKKIHNWETVPIIFVVENDTTKLVGGFDELEKVLNV